MKPFDWARRVLADDRVGVHGRHVACTLALHAKDRRSRMSTRSLVTLTGLSRYSVRQGLSQLTAGGWVAQVRGTRPNGSADTSTWLFIDAQMPVDEQPDVLGVGRGTTQGGSGGDPAGGSWDDHLEGEGSSKDAHITWDDLPDLWRTP